MKRRNFLHLATGASSAALLHVSSTGLAQTSYSWNLLKIGTVFRNEWDSKLLRGGTL